MKPLLVFARIIIVGCLWSIVFIEGIRVIMLCNWHFDIFWGDHWRQFFDLWKAGWEIDAPKEWAFILILITFFPMLITGWWTLCLVAWEDIIRDIIMLPYRIYQYFIKAPLNVITTNNKYGVTKKKSYKQIRPAGVGKIYTPISDYGTESQPAIPAAVAKASGYPTTPALQYTPAQSFSTASNRVTGKVKTDIPATIDHALFKFDDGDDDFDLDIDSFEKTDFSKPNKKEETPKRKTYDDDDDEPRPQKTNRNRSRDTFDFDDDDEMEATRNGHSQRQLKENRNDRDQRKKPNRERDNRNNETNQNRNNEPAERKDSSHNPIYETLQQKGYDIITNITVGGTAIDFVGVSDTDVCLCLVDKETGDWLADEELFNGEDPLWFSEDSHRISPVRKAANAQKPVYNALADAGLNMIVKPYVVIQMANIINADDMFETWDNSGVEVTRINRGMPKEIKLLSKTLPEASGRLNRKDFENIRRILKSLK